MAERQLQPERKLSCRQVQEWIQTTSRAVDEICSPRETHEMARTKLAVRMEIDRLDGEYDEEVFAPLLHAFRCHLQMGANDPESAEFQDALLAFAKILFFAGYKEGREKTLN